MNQNQPFECLYMAGTEDIVSVTMDNDEAAATALNEKAFIVNEDLHCFLAGSTLYWHNSDGVSAYESSMRYVHAVDANTLTLSCNHFIAEDILDENYLYPGVSLDVDWELKQVELHLEAAATAVEDFVIKLDAIKGTYWDTTYYTKAMSGVQDVIWVPGGGPITISKTDILNFTYTNVDSNDWGIKVWYRRLA